MAGDNTVQNNISELSSNLYEFMNELFGECTEKDGILTSRADHLGVTDTSAIVEVVLEGGIREDVQYGILHFHTTIAENIPEGSIPDLLISLAGLNHVINAGSFPGFGTFAFYEPLSQVYLSYRMPVDLNNIRSEYDNIRYYLGALYEQIDIFADFIMFGIVSPGGMTITDYMEYLDQVSDLDDIEERLRLFETQFISEEEE